MSRKNFTEPSSELVVRCHVRASVAAEPPDETIKRLRTHEASGRIERMHVEVWPEKIRLPERTSHDRIVDTYRLFERWAEEEGVDLEPAFTSRSCESVFSNSSWEELILPVICLAAYRNGTIVGIYPHSSDEKTVTVRDALAGIESGKLPTPDGGGRSATPTPGRCPDCRGGMVNGQGLYVCPDCDWHGIATSNRSYRSIGELLPDRSRNITTV